MKFLTIGTGLVFVFFFPVWTLLADHPQQQKYPFTGEVTAEEGYWVITNFPMVRPSFTSEIFENLWQVWEEPYRSEAARASADKIRSMAFARYGLTNRPGKTDGLPLQYTLYGKSGWSINCFACHSGKVAGKIIPSAPNARYAMQTISDDVQLFKARNQQLKLTDVAVGMFPKGNSNGTTNAVMFGVAVVAFRDQHLNFVRNSKIPKFLHHDMDTPAWWNTRHKKWLYLDGAIPANYRALAPFVLGDPRNTGEQVRGWERQFRAIYQYIQSLTSPEYPFPVDQRLAEKGKVVFQSHCASCHGTYGEHAHYPERIVPIEQLKTDRARLDALGKEYFEGYEQNWISFYGRLKCRPQPGGYVAPPLHGIWASAPYLHNGSVPTLWHLLRPSKRPQVWKQSKPGQYNQQKVGLTIISSEKLPENVVSSVQKRRWFNTRLFSKSSAGHLFPEKLSEQEKNSVLEYLKTL